MLTGIFALIGVLIGFYLARFSEINKSIGEKIGEIKENRKPKWGEPFVVRPKEYELEQEELKKKEKAELEKEIKIATGQWQK